MKTLIRLGRLLAPFSPWVALAAILSFLTIASGLALTAMAAFLIAKAAVAADVAALAIAFTSVRAFAISRAVFRYMERVTTHTATFRILAHLRSWFYEAIEPLAPARLGRHRSGDLLARSVADIQTLENFYIRVVVPPIAAALGVAFACALLAGFEWSLAPTLLTFLLLAGLVLPLVTGRLGSRPAAGLIAVRAELNASLVDEVQGTADLLVFDGAGSHRAHALRLSDKIIQLQQRMATLRGLSNAIGSLLAALAALAVLAIAVPLVAAGEIKGTYLALLPLVALASFEALHPLAPALQNLAANLAAGDRIFELIDAPAAVREPKVPLPRPADFSLELRGLDFRYGRAGPLVLEGLSFKVPMGRRLAVVGPSGAGKSTIVNVLLRFWDYDGGVATLGGRELREYSSPDLRSLMGVLPQNIHLFNATIRDNLLLANPDATDSQIEAACRQALLHEFVSGLPQGYETPVGENGLRLSGGERQRLAIARVILKNAPIVILDEPTANLDADTEFRLMESLETFLTGRTVLIISHRSVAVRHAHEVIELEWGRIKPRAPGSS